MLYRPIEEIIKKGENQSVEFKERFDNADKIAEEIIAFSNTNDGDIIFGVKDNGDIIGVDDIEKEKHSIVNTCTNNCQPSINPVLNVKEVNNKKLLIISIKKSKYLQTTNNGKVMIRRDSSKFPAKPNEIENLVRFGYIEKKPDSIDTENLKNLIIKMRYENFYGYRDPTLIEISKEMGHTPEEINPFLYKIAKEIAWVEPSDKAINISENFRLLNKYEIEVLIPSISKSWIKDRGSKIMVFSSYHNNLIEKEITDEMRSYKAKRDLFLSENGFLTIHGYESGIIMEAEIKYGLGDALLLNQVTKRPEGVLIMPESLKNTPIFAIPIIKFFCPNIFLDSEINKNKLMFPIIFNLIVFLMSLSLLSLSIFLVYNNLISFLILFITIPLSIPIGLLSLNILRELFSLYK